MFKKSYSVLVTMCFAGATLSTGLAAHAADDTEKTQLKALVKSANNRLSFLEAKDKKVDTKEADSASHANAPDKEHGSEKMQLRAVVKNLLDDNASFVRSHNPEYFKSFAESQSPRATVVTCADSRVHMHALDKTPDGDLFLVRNIGNQHATGEGSIEYGVHHLHTPLLIFVGHSMCGAIKAASGDYSKLSAPIKKELNTIKIPKDGDITEGVKVNVNNQVAAAKKKYAEEVKEGKLTVIGAFYDFRNDLQQGYGKLVITNVNGETSQEKIKRALSFPNNNDEKTNSEKISAAH